MRPTRRGSINFWVGPNPTPNERLCMAAAEGDVEGMRDAVKDGAVVLEATARVYEPQGLGNRPLAYFCAIHSTARERALAALIEMEPTVCEVANFSYVHNVCMEGRFELMMMILRAGGKLPGKSRDAEFPGYHPFASVDHWSFADEYMNRVCLAGSFEAYKENQYHKVIIIHLLAHKHNVPDVLARRILNDYLYSHREIPCREDPQGRSGVDWEREMARLEI